MIRIQKPAEAPASLLDKGTRLTEESIRRVDAGDGDSLTFDSAVYGAAEVKDTLRRAQQGKCCFCESKIDHIAFGDVEHFRPKGGVRQSPEDELRKPGYYWLAYSWSNLYLACAQCNRRHKRNLFPLANEVQRVRSHLEHDELTLEQPLFIDPGHDDPQQHIEFRGAMATAASGSIRGQKTIEALGLNRAPLWERRRERWEMVRLLLDIVLAWLAGRFPQTFRPRVLRAMDKICTFASGTSEYSAMCCTLLRQTFFWRSIALPAAPAELLTQLESDRDR